MNGVSQLGIWCRWNCFVAAALECLRLLGCELDKKASRVCK